MKKLLIAFVLMLLASPSFAGLTATLGDKNSSNVHRVEVDTDGVVTLAQDTGIKLPYTTATTNTTMTAAQTGTTVVVTPSANNTRMTLPTAVVGMQYSFVSDGTNYMCVKPQSTDTISFASLAAGQNLCNSSTPAKGDSITVFCATAGTWSVKSMRNTWAAGSL